MLQQKMGATRDLQYCKTDLIQSKGIVFCKYSKASSALLALEEITETGTVSPLCNTAVMLLLPSPDRGPSVACMQLAGYKVKCMLAEPKSKGHREVLPPPDMQAAALYRVLAAAVGPALLLSSLWQQLAC